MHVVEEILLAENLAPRREERATGAVVADGVVAEEHIWRPSHILNAPAFAGVQFRQGLGGGDSPGLRTVLGGGVHWGDGLDGPLS